MFFQYDVTDREAELRRIKAIPDKAERLRALQEYIREEQQLLRNLEGDGRPARSAALDAARKAEQKLRREQQGETCASFLHAPGYSS